MTHPRALDEQESDMKLRGDRCRCMECAELFNSTYAFDRHRRGPYTDRRCLSVAAMSGEGFTKNAAGYWLSPRRSDMKHRQKSHPRALTADEELAAGEWYSDYERVGSIRSKAQELGVSPHTLYDSIRRVRGGCTREMRDALKASAHLLEEDSDKSR